jgi:hypothetical protein
MAIVASLETGQINSCRQGKTRKEERREGKAR